MIRCGHPRPLLLLLLLPVWLMACDLLPEQGTVDPALVPTAVVPTATSAPAVTAPASVAPTPATASPLRLWLPPEIGARTAAGSQELTGQVRAFETANRSADVIIEQKPVEGLGGILSYLRDGRSVAPSIMPDVVAVPTTVLADPVAHELFFPLDTLLDSDWQSDLYPAPAAQIMRDGRAYGVPFASVGLTNLVYRPAIVTDTLPLIWSQFISDTNHTLVLPADSRDGALIGLQFYLAEGGTLTNAVGQPDLQVEPLARALEQIALNRANLLQSRQMKTLDEAWQYFQLDLSDFMWTRAEYYLAQQDVRPANELTGLAYARVPGPRGPLTPLTTTWAWAITTGDPTRQALAARLIETLTTPEDLANWSARSQLLPARRAAMSLLAEQDDYFLFAGSELERAQAMPVSESSRLFNALGDAVFQVLTTETPPLAIAEEAAAALRP